MMNQRPDNFFREKLENYQKPAPEGAWDRIELNIKKNENKFGWWKIAASLLLLGTLAYLLLPNAENSTQPIAKKATETQLSSPGAENNKAQNIKDVPNHDAKNTDYTSNKIIPPKKISSKKVKIRKANVTPDPAKRTTPSTSPSESPEKNNDLIDEVIPSSIPEVAQLEPKSAPVSKAKRMTLKFTVDETNEYLDKNTFAQATSDEKKSSTFKKLLKKANDLKSNQDPFGDLREKKNEILALNFKNEKRGQNK